MRLPEDAPTLGECQRDQADDRPHIPDGCAWCEAATDQGDVPDDGQDDDPWA